MLLFCDSFDHYQTPQISEKYPQSSGATITSPGRSGTGNCLEIAGTTGGYVQKDFANPSQLIVGVAFNPSGFGSSFQFIKFYDPGGPYPPTEQGALVVNAAGGLEYHVTINNVDTIVGASQNGIIQTNTFQYVEVDVLFSPTSGAVSAQLNGQNVFSVTGVNTAPSGNSYAGYLLLTSGNIDNYSNYLFDDLYICNGTGPYNNSFLGDVGVDALLPSAPGQDTEWTPNGLTVNWECVGQYPPNSTDYVSSSAPETTDLYKIGQLPSTVSAVVAVQITASAEKNDSGTRVLGVGFGNGTQSVFNSGFSLTSSYVMYGQPYDINPITNARWVLSDINTDGQIGLEVIS